MNPQQTPTPPQEQEPNKQSTSRKKLFIIAGVAIGLLMLPFLVFGLINLFTGDGDSAKSSDLYSALANASQKTKVQQHTSYKLWKTGVATTAEPSRYELTLSEFDASSKEFRTINASTNLGDDAERCIGGAGYRYRITSDRSEKGMAGIVETLNDSTSVRSDLDKNSNFSPCTLTNTRHKGKFSDGIMPVGITAEQATSWINYLKAKEVFSVKDEGSSQYKGKEVRKIAIATASPRDTSNIFYAVRDGDTGQVSGSGINWQLAFGQHISQNLGTPTGLKGYYLISLDTNLPVYSEFNSTVPDGKTASKLETFAAKTEYAYPETLSLTEVTKLADL